MTALGGSVQTVLAAVMTWAGKKYGGNGGHPATCAGSKPRWRS